jgi:hypothetical protein
VATLKRPSKRGGCGCLLLFLAVFLAPFGFAGFGIVSAVRHAIDADSGEIQDEGVLTYHQRDEGGIGTGETDRWQLAGEDAQVRISVFADGDFDPVVTIRPVGGAQFGRDDDGGDDRDARLVVDLRAGTDYHVDVTGFGSSSGDYDILVERESEIPPEVPQIEAGPLAVRQPITADVPADVTTRYRFTGEGREVTISVRAVDDYDPVVTVRNQAGLQLGRDDDSGGGPTGRDSLLRVTVPGGETVFVDVEEFSGDAGSYTIEVT